MDQDVTVDWGQIFRRLESYYTVKDLDFKDVSAKYYGLPFKPEIGQNVAICLKDHICETKIGIVDRIRWNSGEALVRVVGLGQFWIGFEGLMSREGWDGFKKR